jgi:hypothetical protein
MIPISDIVADPAGNVIAGVLVTVKLAGTETLATLYSDDGVTPLGNPVTTDAEGLYVFYVADGNYTLTPSKDNYSGDPRTIAVVSGGGLAANGIPVGGTTAQMLVKSSATDYATEWADQPAVVVGPTWTEALGDYSTADNVEFAGNASFPYGFDAGEQTNLTDVVVLGGLAEYHQAVVALDIVSGTASLFSKTLTAPSVFTFDGSYLIGLDLVVSFTLEITNSGGAQTITWPASVKWPGGAVPTPTTGIDLYTFYTRDNGVTWRGALVASYVS